MRSVPSSATQNSVRRPSATTTPRAPPASATRTCSSIATVGSIRARATSRPSRFQLGGQARRQRIVVGQRQQDDARMRRRRARRRRAPRQACARRGRARGNAAAASTNRRQISDRGCRGQSGVRPVGERRQVAVGGGACSRIVACFDPRLQQKAGRLARERAVRETLHVADRTTCRPRRSPGADRRRSCRGRTAPGRRRRREPPVRRLVRVLGALEVAGETRGLAQLRDVLGAEGAGSSSSNPVAHRRRERFLEPAARLQRRATRRRRARASTAPRRGRRARSARAARRRGRSRLVRGDRRARAPPRLPSPRRLRPARLGFDRRRGVRRHRRVLDHHRRCRFLACPPSTPFARSRWPVTTRAGAFRPGPVTSTEPSCIVTVSESVRAIPARGEARPGHANVVTPGADLPARVRAVDDRHLDGPVLERDRRAVRVQRVDVRLRARRQRHLRAVGETQRQRRRVRGRQPLADRAARRLPAPAPSTAYESGCGRSTKIAIPAAHSAAPSQRQPPRPVRAPRLPALIVQRVRGAPGSPAAGAAGARRPERRAPRRASAIRDRS